MKISQVDAVLSKGGIFPPLLEWILKIGTIISIFGMIAGVACFFVEGYGYSEKIEGVISVIIGFGIFIFLFSCFIL